MLNLFQTKNLEINKMMFHILIATIPIIGMSIFLYGINVLIILLVTVASCLASESLINSIRKKKIIDNDSRAIMVSGILLALTMPSNINPTVAMFGGIILIVLKQIFGGFENNFASPIIVSRVALILSFPDIISKPIVIHSSSKSNLIIDLLTKNQSNFIGGSCFLAVLVGAIYLMIKKIVNPIVPVVILLTSLLVGVIIPENYYIYALSGTVLFCSSFLVTNYIPEKTTGKVLFSICCGIIYPILKFNTNVTESILFSILFMQTLSLSIDRLLNLKFLKKGVTKRD